MKFIFVLARIDLLNYTRDFNEVSINRESDVKGRFLVYSIYIIIVILIVFKNSGQSYINIHQETERKSYCTIYFYT